MASGAPLRVQRYMTIRPDLEPIPPTLAEVGQVLWGASWAGALARSSRLTKEEVIALDVPPTKSHRPSLIT